IESHMGKLLFQTPKSLFDTNGIAIVNCRDQSYDNASNVAEKYEGLQALIKRINPLAEYLQGTAHSLN
ncbi:hypothetical protein KIL84_012876, partial [Mauremys mutica]